MYKCVRFIDFVIGFWNSFDSVVCIISSFYCSIVTLTINVTLLYLRLFISVLFHKHIYIISTCHISFFHQSFYLFQYCSTNTSTSYQPVTAPSPTNPFVPVGRRATSLKDLFGTACAMGCQTENCNMDICIKGKFQKVL